MGVYLSKFSNWLYDSKWLRIFSILFSNRCANQITNLIHQLKCGERWFWFRGMCTFYIQGWRLLRLVCSDTCRYLAVQVISLFWYIHIPKKDLGKCTYLLISLKQTKPGMCTYLVCSAKSYQGIFTIYTAQFLPDIFHCWTFYQLKFRTLKLCLWKFAA